MAKTFDKEGEYLPFMKLLLFGLAGSRRALSDSHSFLLNLAEGSTPK